jgi:hypothetical protein
VGRVAIVSANYGAYDHIWPQVEQDVEVDWFMFTDDRKAKPVEPWKLIYEPAKGLHPNMAAKQFKCSPPVPHRFVLWMDASMEVIVPTFVRLAFRALHDGLATYEHPRRMCIYDEVEASLGCEDQNGRYAHLPMREQAAHYRANGHPALWGLYGCGTIAWDRGDERIVRFGDAWLHECAAWGYQDQISFPVLCRRFGIKPGVFPIRQQQSAIRRQGKLGNLWQIIHEHRA